MNWFPKTGFALFLVLLFMFSPVSGFAGEMQTVIFEVQEVLEQPATATDTGTVRAVLEFKSGRDRGDTHLSQRHQWGEPNYDKNIFEGAQFVGQVEYRNDERRRVRVGERRREDGLLILFLVLSLLLFIIGRWQGLIGLLSAVLTAVLLFYILFPIISTPTLILPLAVLICLLTAGFTFAFVTDFQRPAGPAIISIVLTLIIIFPLTIWGLGFLHLDSSLARHSRMILTWVHRTPGLQPGDLWRLIATGIVLSALGAIMDVIIVISSTIDEIVRDNLSITFTEAFASGQRVGRQILSTMVNTLVFAYLGALLPLMLAIRVFDLDWLRFLNYNFIGIEILRLTVGLFGLAIVIPITSSVSAWWCSSFE